LSWYSKTKENSVRMVGVDIGMTFGVNNCVRLVKEKVQETTSSAENKEPKESVRTKYSITLVSSK
jgi:hypothetical protein